MTSWKSFFKNNCGLLGVEKTRTCPYNPKSDGLVERFNRTLISMISLFVNENRKDWNDHLPYRATCHKSTGLSPHLVMLNREVNFPIGLMAGQPPGTPEVECPIQYVEWVKSATAQAFEFAYSQLGVAASHQKKIMIGDLNPANIKGVMGSGDGTHQQLE